MNDRFRLVTATDGSCYITDNGRIALWVYGCEVKKDQPRLKDAEFYALSIVTGLNSLAAEQVTSPDIDNPVEKGL